MAITPTESVQRPWSVIPLSRTKCARHSRKPARRWTSSNCPTPSSAAWRLPTIVANGSRKTSIFLCRCRSLSYPTLLEDLRRRGFEFDTLVTIADWTKHHMVALSYHGIRIDWLKPVIPSYLHVLERATEENWFGRPIRIASVEGLILLKLVAFRTQDQLDIENLVAANSDKLDLDWIRAEWQCLADLDYPRMRRPARTG